MSNGPSKEDLEFYWQNSRQYFDELAEHYQQADPEYYRTYIKPFYDNPFRSTGKKNPTSVKSGAKFIVIAVLFLVAAGAGAVFFLISKSTDTVEKKFEEKINKMVNPPEEKKSEEKVNETANEEDTKDLSDEDKYIIGAKYISEKKYDKAVYYLKRIPPTSKRYEEAQQLIKSVKYLKKYNK